MITDVQREVAIHLLANALRRLRGRELDRPPVPDDGAGNGLRLLPPRSATDEAYLRGMLDILRALYGPAAAEELHRAARAFERSNSTR